MERKPWRTWCVLSVAVLAMIPQVWGQEETPETEPEWIRRLRAVDLLEVDRVACQAARDPELVNASLGELLRAKDLPFDPVRVAVRVDPIDDDLVKLCADVPAARKLVRLIGPRLSERSREAALAILRAGGKPAREIAMLSPYIWATIPDEAQAQIALALRENPKNRDALVALTMVPELGRDESVREKLAMEIGFTHDPLLLVTSGLVTGRREEVAQRLVDVARQRDDLDAESILQMLDVVDASSDALVKDVLQLAASRRGLMPAAGRVWSAHGVPTCAETLLASWVESDDEFLVRVAASMVCSSELVVAKWFPLVCGFARSHDRDIREMAAIALGRYAEHGFECVEDLLRLLDDTDDGIKFTALQALGSIRGSATVRRHLIALARSGEYRAIIELWVRRDPALRGIVRAHLESGGSAEGVTEIIAQAGWDDLLALCRRQLPGAGEWKRAGIILASLVRARTEAQRATYTEEWRKLGAEASGLAIARWLNRVRPAPGAARVDGFRLPAPILSECEKRLWAWGDESIATDAGTRLEMLDALVRGGRVGGREQRNAILRIFSVLLDGTNPSPFDLEAWFQRARTVDSRVMPWWYFRRMSRNPQVHYRIRSYCRRLLDSR